MGTEHPPITTATRAKVTAAAAIGGIVEYFDMYTASLVGAIVWPKIFFPSASVASSLAFSIASVGLSYVIRPVGGYIFGHVGDRIGRKDTMVITLMLVGVSMFFVGLLPTYSTIGIAAPILLFILRGIFGLGLGGEFGGAVSWILEFAATSKWRSFWAIWSSPTVIGTAIAGVVVSLLGETLKADFYTYGWRIPFIIGGVLIIIGFIARYRLQESPLFVAIKKKGEVEKAPASGVLKKYWKTIFVIATITGAIQAGITSSLVTPYSVAYLSGKGLSFTFLTGAIALTNAISLIAWIGGPYFCEKLGRKRHLLLSISWALIGVVIFLPLVNTLNLSMIVLAYLILEMQRSFNNAAIQAVCGESFPTRYRVSGSGLSYQIGNGLFSGLQMSVLFPMIILYSSAALAPVIIVLSIVIWLILALFSLRALKETKEADLSQ